MKYKYKREKAPKARSNCTGKICKKAVLPAVIFAFAGLLASCSATDNAKDNTAESTAENWIESITDESGVYIGQEKEVVGYYKRIGIAKINSTYEDMLELRDIEKQGYLVANDDGTAFFDLNGEKTEYIFDKKNFYLSDDTEKANGFSYTCINGRLIINDGITITQYMRLTDEEAADYLERSKAEYYEDERKEEKD